MSDDVVVRLQATLDEREREHHRIAGALMEAARWKQELAGGDYVRQVVEEGLRLVQSHRDLIAEWRQQAQIRDLLDEPDQKQSDAYLTAVGITAGLWAAVTIVARGYGIEDQTGKAVPQ